MSEPEQPVSITKAEVALVFTVGNDGVWTGTWEPPIADPVTGSGMWPCVQAAIEQLDAMDDPPATVRFVMP